MTGRGDGGDAGGGRRSAGVGWFGAGGRNGGGLLWIPIQIGREEGGRVGGVGARVRLLEWIRGVGSGIRPAGPFGLMACWLAGPFGPGGGGFFLFIFFLFCSFSFYLFSFIVLIQLRAHKYFINLCFLYYNYLCNIWH